MNLSIHLSSRDVAPRVSSCSVFRDDTPPRHSIIVNLAENRGAAEFTFKFVFVYPGWSKIIYLDYAYARAFSPDEKLFEYPCPVHDGNRSLFARGIASLARVDMVSPPASSLRFSYYCFARQMEDRHESTGFSPRTRTPTNNWNKRSSHVRATLLSPRTIAEITLNLLVRVARSLPRRLIHVETYFYDLQGRNYYTRLPLRNWKSTNYISK